MSIRVELSSPKPWYKIFQSPSGKNLSINGGSSEAKSQSPKTPTKTSRPISLLASISDFDRQAAEILSQRQKEAKTAKDKGYYVTDTNDKAGLFFVHHIIFVKRLLYGFRKG